MTAVVAAVAMPAGLLAKRRHARRLSFLGMTIAGISLALSGHASTAVSQWLTRPAVFVHTISVLFWVGSLAPLAIIMRGEAHEDVLARFSKIIPWVVAALLVSGLVLAIIQVADPAALISTSYGRVLAAKLALVAFILTLAAWNRLRLTPGVMSRASGVGQKLARSIVAETAGVLVILGLVAGWRFTPPPRSLAVVSLRPVLVHIHTKAAMALVTLSSGRVGTAQVDVMLMSGDFGSLDAKEVRLTIENKMAGIEAISREAAKTVDGHWLVRQLPLPVGYADRHPGQRFREDDAARPSTIRD